MPLWGTARAYLRAPEPHVGFHGRSSSRQQIPPAWRGSTWGELQFHTLTPWAGPGVRTELTHGGSGEGHPSGKQPWGHGVGVGGSRAAWGRSGALSSHLSAGCPWQELEARNAELEQRLHLAEQTLAETLAEREKMHNEVAKVAEIMDVKIFELSELRQGLAKLVESN